MASYPKQLSKSHFLNLDKILMNHVSMSIIPLLPSIKVFIMQLQLSNHHSHLDSRFTESSEIRNFQQIIIVTSLKYRSQSSSTFSLFLYISMLIISYHSSPPHIAWELTDSLLIKLELEKIPSFMLEVSEYILDDRPRIPILSQGDISGVLE